ncbi:hypothetical protein SAMN04488696_1838 [Methanolobus profundi]|uniref:Uncharacterized protein n=1 Tax=Methanolobus profundi TaxID=487685 RepID=A0A1I4S8N7_9EURY|nr:hypothetical protein SAMN04488696_1838 [Methanolobus profundi]
MSGKISSLISASGKWSLMNYQPDSLARTYTQKYDIFLMTLKSPIATMVNQYRFKRYKEKTI